MACIVNFLPGGGPPSGQAPENQPQQAQHIQGDRGQGSRGRRSGGEKEEREGKQGDEAVDPPLRKRGERTKEHHKARERRAEIEASEEE